MTMCSAAASFVRTLLVSKQLQPPRLNGVQIIYDELRRDTLRFISVRVTLYKLRGACMFWYFHVFREIVRLGTERKRARFSGGGRQVDGKII